MRLIFSEHAWEDYLYWQRTDRKILERINKLIKEIRRSPFEGTGKPEPLRHGLSGYWSRRTNEEHRIVYKVESDSLLIAQLRYHY
ncbi:MAG: Txe/YoeB family addiction module toxin [Deltaproteobacteria bacterium]|nr:Txe/YoeB family addiction module toxin [Deltaproteobacteria bacterium]